MSVPLQTVLHGFQLLVSFHAGFLGLALSEDSQICSKPVAQEAVLLEQCTQGRCGRGSGCLLGAAAGVELALAALLAAHLLMELLWPPFINQELL